jgi:hypothetical protein
MNSPLKAVKKQLSKKKSNMAFGSIYNFFATKEPFKKNDVQQKPFLKDLGLFNVKDHLPLQFVESISLK